jgi:RHS repeat-associated protein
MKRISARIITAISFLITVPVISAQSYMDQPGIPEFTTAFPVDHGFINIANGALHLEIPIASYPQRGGKLQYNARLVYDSRFWTFDPNADDSPNGWQPNGVTGYPQPFGVGWRLITGGEVGNPSSTSKLMLQCSSGAGGQIGPFYKTLYSNFRYQEGNGTVHLFTGIPTLTQNNVNCGIGGGNGTASALASDNSGFRMDVNNFVISAVYAPDGTQVYPKAQDSNGNYMSDSFQQVPGVGYVEHVLDTLSREPVIGSFSGNPVTQIFYDFLNPQGSRSRITVNLAPLSLATNFGTGGDYTGAAVAVQSIVFPDNTSYQFQYDSYGQITTMTLPTGGQITYGYTNTTAPNVVNRWLTSRTLLGNTWTFTPVFNSCTAPCNPLTVTVTTPPYNDGISTTSDNHVYSFFFSSPKGGGGAWPAQIQYFRGPTTGTPLVTLTKDYNNGTNNSCQLPMGNALTPVLVRETLSWPSGSGTLSKKMEYCYDANGVNIIAKKGWNYQPNGNFAAAPDREIDTAYVTDPAYVSANILTWPLTVTTLGPGGAQVAKTTYAYDAGTLQPSNITTQHATPAGPRGNLTSVSKWLNTTNSTITSSTAWFDTGKVYQSADPLGHTTTFTYDPAFAGAYVTQTCNPLSQCSYANYDFNTGSLISSTDINGSAAGDPSYTSTYTYDSMLRPLCTNVPDGGQSCVSYPSATTTTRTTKISSALNELSSVILDSLGRPSQTQHVTPAGTARVDTTYDPLGRVASVSNPYFATTDSTYGVTQSTYDGLSRTIKITRQDGSIATSQFSFLSGNVNGSCVTNTDEAGKQRRLCHNGFGELIEVDEPGDSFAGTNAAGSLPVNGTLKSTVVGAQPATAGSGSLTITGTEGSATIDPCAGNGCITPGLGGGGGGGGSCPQTVFDVGTVTITVNGHPDQTSYGAGSNDATVASGLASAINSDANAFVTATASNGTLILTAKQTGAASNYSWSLTSQSTDTTGNFGPAGSFGSSPVSGTLTGGTNGSGGTTVYDTGNVSVTVGSFTATVSYGPSPGNSTSAMVASALASALSASNSPVTATASGSTVSITYKSVGVAGNIGVASTSTSTQTQAAFSPPSFTSPGAALSGGLNPEGPSLDFNYFVTQYGYDALGNLLQVTQKGDPSVTPSTQWRVRNFTYDSLSRLLTAANPESGNISYVYDNDGNLLQKTSSAPNQTNPATTQTISYCYDALHRATGRAYSAQSCPLTSPVVAYTYDVGTNGKGHLSSLSDQAGTGAYTYDALGRLLTEQRMLIGTANVSKSLSYTYNLDGSVRTLTYPSNAVITYTPWNNGSAAVRWPQEAKDLGNNINYATTAAYGPDGSLTNLISGSGGPASITNTFVYNNRLQVCRMAASSTGAIPTSCINSFGNILDLSYDFHLGSGDNGNVYGITNYRDQSRNQSFTYDPLNRLISAQNAGTDCTVHLLQNKTKFWGNSYSYDAWGNLLGKTVSKCGAENLSVTADPQNRIHASGTDYQYDAAGNMTHDATSTLNYNFDQENRLTGASGYTYTYDDEGNRVRKSNGNTASSGTLYWYMTPGVVAESDLAGTLKSEYIFFDGERVARKDFPGNTVAYYFSDRLKTASVITDASGTITAESDYYPWGGEIQFVNNDLNDYKFTGKKRDAETGLDYFGARYYSNPLGRFLTPDWSPVPVPVPYADLSDPQSLNQYSYVRDVPTSQADPEGHDPSPPQRAYCPSCHDYLQDNAATQPAPKANIPPPPPPACISCHDATMNQDNSNNGVPPPPPPPNPAQSGSQSTSPAPPGQESQNQKQNDKDTKEKGAEKTEHGQERADQARQGDPHRDVGDPNRVIREGRQYTDTETGNSVSVRGNKVVIRDKDGNIVSQFKNTRANTNQRVQDGRWIPKSEE